MKKTKYNIALNKQNIVCFKVYSIDTFIYVHTHTQYDTIASSNTPRPLCGPHSDHHTSHLPGGHLAIMPKSRVVDLDGSQMRSKW